MGTMGKGIEVGASVLPDAAKVFAVDALAFANGEPGSLLGLEAP